MLTHFFERWFESWVGSNKQERPALGGPFLFGTPYRIRTGVTAVRGRRPEPLDEGSIVYILVPPVAGGCYYTAADPMLKKKIHL
jgi:hypothetical protein